MVKKYIYRLMIEFKEFVYVFVFLCIILYKRYGGEIKVIKEKVKKWEIRVIGDIEKM